MWFTPDPIDTNYAGGSATPKTPFGIIKEFKDAVNDAYSPIRIQGFFTAIESEAKSLTNSISNGLIANQKVIGETLYNLYKDTLQYGAGWSDISDYLSTYAENLGKLPNIQDATIQRAIIFSKATGLSTKEVAGFVASMSKIGIGQDVALSKLEKMYLTARKYGVDAKDLTKEVLKNISKTSTYGFKDGVDGLTKMVARGKQLGITMESVMKTQSKAFEVDDAVKMASEIQMLGGAVGALGDPFQLLYMAQNDIGKLQEEIVNATKSTVEFNEETGEFKLPVSEMYRMRAMASSLGLEYQDLADAAVNAAKQQEVLTRSGGLTQYSEEDRNLVASLAEIKDGKVMIQIPGQKGMIDAANLTQEQIDKLKKDQDEKANPEEAMKEIAKAQLSAQQSASIALTDIKNAVVYAKGIAGLSETEGYPKMLNDLSSIGQQIQDRITENVGSGASTLISDFDTAMKTQITNLETYTKNIGTFATDLTELSTKFKNMYSTLGGVNNLLESGEWKDLLKLQDPNQATDDLIDLSAVGKKTYTDGFGKMWEFNKNDQVLAMPNIDELFNFTNNAYDTLSSIQANVGKVDYGSVTEMLMNKISPTSTKQQPEQINNIQDILSRNTSKMNEIEPLTINQTNTTTQKVEGNVGVDGNVNINVNIPNGLLSSAFSGDREFQQSIKDEIMNVVNDRLSKAYSQRQGNFSS
jgi:hypothetical protein